jgi:amino acid adenylation domain-containing protein
MNTPSTVRSRSTQDTSVSAARVAALALLALRRFPARPGTVTLDCACCGSVASGPVDHGTTGSALLDIAARLDPVCAHETCTARPDDDRTRALGYAAGSVVEPADDRRWTGPTAAALLDRTADRLRGHPTTAIERLDLTAPGDRPATVDPAPQATAGSVPHAILLRAERTPDAVAALAAEGAVTYRQLVRRAAGVAAALAARAVHGPVAVDLDPADGTATEVVLLLGVLAAGCWYVPLDRRGPRHRIAEQLRAARPTLLVSDRDPGFPVPTVRPDGLLAAEADPAEADWTERTPTDPAYTMFTSGSTGAPKGVVVPHEAVLRLAASDVVPPDVRGGRFLRAAPLAFDASTFELWVPLLNGGTVVPLGGPAADLRFVEQRLRDADVDVAWFTAGLFHQACALAPETFGALRVLATGGDVVRPDAVATVLAAAPGLTVVNGYGPTENTTFTATHTITAPEDALARRRLPIGRPVSGDIVSVVDQDGRPVPPGLAGELVVAGRGVALGYLDGVGEPFGVVDHHHDSLRRYRTGDMVTVLSDGRLDFLGRVDGQVKLRGFRVEVTEIEAALVAMPSVAAAAVAPPTADNGDTFVAAVVLRPGADAEGLRRSLRDLLPDYMIPDRVLPVAALPLGRTGKVDRSRISDLVGGSEPAAPGRTKPSIDPVRDAVALVLGHADFTDDDNLIDKGLHSLRAFRLLRELRKLRVTVSLRDVMTAVTVQRLRETVRGTVD